MTQYPSFIESIAKELHRLAEANAISIRVLKDKHFRSNLSTGDQLLNKTKTFSTDQAGVKDLIGGLRLKTPFNNLTTKGWFPILKPSIGAKVEDRALRYVFTVE